MSDCLFGDDDPPDFGRAEAGKVARKHPHTSADAAVEVAFRAGTAKDEIIKLLATRAQLRGLTAAEAHAMNPDKFRSRNQTATRFLELREMGAVEYLMVGDRYAERFTDARHRNTGRVYVLTPAGWAYARTKGWA